MINSPNQATQVIKTYHFHSKYKVNHLFTNFNEKRTIYNNFNNLLYVELKGSINNFEFVWCHF